MAVEAGGIGARLRAGREKLGLTVLQVAERIHTDPKIVEAIEAETYEVLGAPVYARGHIRHYAELVGESANELIQMYANLNRVAQPDLTRIVKAPVSPEANKLVAPALVVVAVFAVAGAIWWVSALSKKEPQMSESHLVVSEVLPSGPASEVTSSPESAGALEGVPAAGGVAGSPAAGGAPAAFGAPRSTPGSAVGTPLSAAPGGATHTPSSAGMPATSARPSATGGSAAAPGATSRPVPTSQPARPASSTAAPPAQANRAVPPAAAPQPGRAVAPAATLTAQANRAVPSAAAPAPANRATSSAVATPPAAAYAQTRTASATPTRTALPAAGATAAGTAAAAAAASTAASDTTAPRPKNQSQVTLHYTADSWTEVYDSTGARLFYDVGSANSVKTLVGTPPLRVVLGNAAGVSVEYNGHSKPIAKLSRPDGSVQFSITRSGEVVRAKPVADGG